MVRMQIKSISPEQLARIKEIGEKSDDPEKRELAAFCVSLVDLSQEVIALMQRVESERARLHR